MTQKILPAAVVPADAAGELCAAASPTASSGGLPAAASPLGASMLKVVTAAKKLGGVQARFMGETAVSRMRAATALGYSAPIKKVHQPYLQLPPIEGGGAPVDQTPQYGSHSPIPQVLPPDGKLSFTHSWMPPGDSADKDGPDVGGQDQAQAPAQTAFAAAPPPMPPPPPPPPPYGDNYPVMPFASPHAPAPYGDNYVPMPFASPYAPVPYAGTHKPFPSANGRQPGNEQSPGRRTMDITQQLPSQLSAPLPERGDGVDAVAHLALMPLRHSINGSAPPTAVTRQMSGSQYTAHRNISHPLPGTGPLAAPLPQSRSALAAGPHMLLEVCDSGGEEGFSSPEQALSPVMLPPLKSSSASPAPGSPASSPEPGGMLPRVMASQLSHRLSHNLNNQLSNALSHQPSRRSLPLSVASAGAGGQHEPGLQVANQLSPLAMPTLDGLPSAEPPQQQGKPGMWNRLQPVNANVSLAAAAKERAASVMQGEAASVHAVGANHGRRFTNTGVTVRYLQRFAAAAIPPGTDPSTAQIVRDYVLPQTEARQCRFLDLIPQQYLKPPRIYVSHAWCASFSDLVESITRHCTDHLIDPAQCTVWLDCLCANQHTPGADLHERDLAVVAEIIGGCKNVLLVVDSGCWCCTRLWVLYELYLGVVHSRFGSDKLQVATAAPSFEAVLGAFHDMDPRRALTSRAQDRSVLMQEMTARLGPLGLTGVVSDVKAVLLRNSEQSWLHASQNRNRKPQRYREMSLRFSLVLSMDSQFWQAERVMRQVLMWARDNVVRVDATGQASLTALAVLMKVQGFQDEAERLGAQALGSAGGEIEGVSIEDICSGGRPFREAFECIAEVLLLKQEYSAAERIFTEVLAACDEEELSCSPVAATSMRHLAHIRRLRGQLSLAEEGLRVSIVTADNAFGRGHLEGARCRQELAECLLEQRRAQNSADGGEAAALLADVRSVRQSLLGDEHHSALQVMVLQGAAMIVSRQYEAAAAHLENLLETCCRTLNVTHASVTALCRSELAILRLALLESGSAPDKPAAVAETHLRLSLHITRHLVQRSDIAEHQVLSALLLCLRKQHALEAAQVVQQEVLNLNHAIVRKRLAEAPNEANADL